MLIAILAKLVLVGLWLGWAGLSLSRGPAELRQGSAPGVAGGLGQQKFKSTS